MAYRFDITYRTVAAAVGAAGRAAGSAAGSATDSPTVETQFEDRGSVKAVEGEMLPNEHFDLHVEERTYHIWRDEERWHIEA